MLCFAPQSMTHYHDMTGSEANVPQHDPTTQPPPPPLSCSSLSIISVDVYWWWMGPICQLPIMPTCHSRMLQVSLTWAPSQISGGPWSINPFLIMTAGHLSLDEIDTASHPSCCLQLLVINARSTCMLPGQSHMLMKTYALWWRGW